MAFRLPKKSKGILNAQWAMRALSLGLLVISLSAVSGCWGKRELEDRAFVTILGIDHASDGGILASALLSLPAGRGGGNMGGGTQSDGSLLISTAGRNIEEALAEMEYLSSRELNTVYMAFVILGEEFARTDVGPVVDVFSRHLHYKPDTLLGVCKGRAYDFLRDFKPQQETHPSDYLWKLVDTAHSGLGTCPMTTMHDLKVGYVTPAEDPWAPYFELVPYAPAEAAALGNRGGDGGEGAKEQEGQQGNGKTARLAGTALFAKSGEAYSMVGTLDPWESMAVLLMRGEVERGLIHFAYPGAPETQATLVLHHTDRHLDLEVLPEAAIVKYHIAVTSSLSEVPAGPEPLPETTQEFRRAVAETAEQQLKFLLERTFGKLTSLGCDAIALGPHAQVSFKTFPEWEAYDWHNRFHHCQGTFTVKVHVFTSGFTVVRPVPK
ncbi:MAG: Ger(x)C family spore germination protein [Bacillota bacterium]